MQFIRSIQAVDTHTLGEPTRIVTGGIPRIPGASLSAKRQHMAEHADQLRTAIMLEPRGHDEMFGAIITEPCAPEADFGIIFMDGGGYLNMCGHGTIAAMTVAVETGMVAMVEPVTRVVLEAPAGLVRGEVRVEGGRVREVSFVNVPAFLYRADLELQVPGMGAIRADIAFGGNFFALVSAPDLGLELTPAQIPRLGALGLQIRDLANSAVQVRHPFLEHIRSVDLVEFSGPALDPAADSRNVVVFGHGRSASVDRSPCGTGTCAKMAALHHRGRLAVGQDFVHESILGTLFRGRILETLDEGGFPAVRPRITGSAYITGFNHFVIDERDPLKYGFRL
jgi:proline racemase